MQTLDGEVRIEIATLREVLSSVSRKFETDAGHLCNPKAVNGWFCKHLGASRGKLKVLKIGAAKVPTVKQLFRNAARSDQPLDTDSNSEKPMFYCISKIDFSKKVPYQGRSGEPTNALFRIRNPSLGSHGWSDCQLKNVEIERLTSQNC